MDKIVSAGGLVTYENTLLMLKKKNGEWVLPKGRVESGESLETTALREVKEESNIEASLEGYVGITHYTFCNYWTEYKTIDKTVHWYKMRALSTDLIAQKEEGFVEAKFLPFELCLSSAKYKDEKEIIVKMFKDYLDL